MKCQALFKVILLVAALDSLAYGLWACVWPDNLLTHLDLPPRDPIKWKLLGIGLETADHILLWRCLGAFFLAHAVILALVAWRPRARGSLAIAPLIGRLLPLGLWFWLLGTDRLELPRLPLRILAGHDALCVAVILVFLGVWYYARNLTRPRRDL